MENNFIQHRQKAIDWLNSDRNFDAGILLLEQSKFRPGVVQKLKRDGVNGPEAVKRLKFLIQELIKAWTFKDEELKDTSVDDGIVNGKDIQQTTNHDDKSAMGILAAATAIESGETTLPETIDAIVRKYATAYRHRDILHKQLAEMPEDNESSTMDQRKELSDEISELTDEMERLYPFYKAYYNDGTIPTEEDLLPKEENTTQVDETSQTPALSKDELQKKRKSTATKLSRAKNMLDYQTETKGKEPNPMPESPKRVKYETKVQKLTEELNDIDYQIAALG